MQHHLELTIQNNFDHKFNALACSIHGTIGVRCETKEYGLCLEYAVWMDCLGDRDVARNRRKQSYPQCTQHFAWLPSDTCCYQCRKGRKV
jgi:hypothetical protein